jgi:hypothetical protein
VQPRAKSNYSCTGCIVARVQNVSNTGAACLIGTVARLLSTRDEGHAELACKRSLASHRRAEHELRCIDPISGE